jgi:RNA polymerase sigma-70 factor (ECF subfamily)
VYNFALCELRDSHAAEDLTARCSCARWPGCAIPRAGPAAEQLACGSSRLPQRAVARARRSRRHPDAPLDAALELPAADDVPATAAGRDELRAALRAIDLLPADRRRALVLRFVDELDAREIGQVLGRSEGATRVLIHRSLQAVARQLGRSRGVDEAERPAERRRATN